LHLPVSECSGAPDAHQFIVAAGVSRLKLLLPEYNERTHVRCYGIYATEPELRPPSLEIPRDGIGIDISYASERPRLVFGIKL